MSGARNPTIHDELALARKERDFAVDRLQQRGGSSARGRFEAEREIDTWNAIVRRLEQLAQQA